MLNAHTRQASQAHSPWADSQNPVFHQLGSQAHKWFHACTGGGGGENGELLLSPCSDGRDLTHCWQNVSISPSVLSCLIFSPGFLMPCEFQPQFYTDVTKGPGKAELLLVVLPGNCAVRLAFHPPQRTCIIRVQMGCEWKHVLLYMANLPYPVPMCTICFQCRGRPVVYFKVF